MREEQLCELLLYEQFVIYGSQIWQVKFFKEDHALVQLLSKLDQDVFLDVRVAKVHFLATSAPTKILDKCWWIVAIETTQVLLRQWFEIFRFAAELAKFLPYVHYYSILDVLVDL